MKTYNALIGMEVKAMNIQEMLDKARLIAEAQGSCKVWNYDDDEADELIHCYKTTDGRIITLYAEEIAKQIA